MAISNPVFNRVREAIEPVVAIGVGSAICSVCSKNQLNTNNLEEEDIPILKKALVEHYRAFWPNKLVDIEKAINSV